MTPASDTIVEFPTTREEAWRYTALDEIVGHFESAGDAGSRAAAVTRELVDELAGSHGGSRLVFVNGTYDAALSDRTERSPGLRCDGVSSIDLASWTDPPEHHGRDGFLARNRSSGHDAGVIVVDPAAVIDEPVHIVHLAAPDPHAEDGQSTISHPRTIIDVGEDGRVCVIETYTGLDGATVSNAATTIRLGPGADVDHYRIQTESPSAVHVGNTSVDQAERARLRSTAITVGAAIARNATGIRLAGPAAALDIAGVNLTTGRQRHDTVVTVDHTSPRCASSQRFAGVVNDHGRGSFSGEIIVREGADGTDAHQSNRNLVLSRDAEADTRPWLQILADDVRCTHGATVGRLDDDALFYLRSRGVPLMVARTMLIEAFVHDVTDRIAIESLRDEVVSRLAAVDHNANEVAS